jgi:hypothetical protein
LTRKPRTGGAGLPEFVNGGNNNELRLALNALPTQAPSTPQRTALNDGTATPRHSHIFKRESHGFYVEPSWVSIRLFAVEDFGATGARILDPACGWGRILQAAKLAGFTVVGSDIVDRRNDFGAFTQFPFTICDFLARSPIGSAWSVVCNPPFDHSEAFCDRALKIATYKVAVLVPLRRLPAARWLRQLPLETIYLLTPRPSMPPGAWIAGGGKVGNGIADFVWLVFNLQMPAGREPRLRWLQRRGHDGK